MSKGFLLNKWKVCYYWFIYYKGGSFSLLLLSCLITNYSGPRNMEKFCPKGKTEFITNKCQFGAIPSAVPSVLGLWDLLQLCWEKKELFCVAMNNIFVLFVICGWCHLISPHDLLFKFLLQRLRWMACCTSQGFEFSGIPECS